MTWRLLIVSSAVVMFLWQLCRGILIVFLSLTFDGLTVPRRILTPLVADKITEADKKPGRRARYLCYSREANCVSEVVLAHALHKSAVNINKTFDVFLDETRALFYTSTL